MPDQMTDDTSRIEALISLTQELSALLAAENDALRMRRPRELATFQPEKARLAAAYAQSIRDIASDRGRLVAASDGLVERLREITRSFERTAQAQQVLLDGARAASEGVLEAITSEAMEQRPTYGTAAAGELRSRPVVLDERT